MVIAKTANMVDETTSSELCQRWEHIKEPIAHQSNLDFTGFHDRFAPQFRTSL